MKMFRLIALAAALCLGAGTAHAAEPPLIGLLNSLCVANDAEPAGVLDTARKQGFKPTTYKFPAGNLKDAVALEKSSGANTFLLISGRGADAATADLPATATRACGVAMLGSDPAAVAAARTWVPNGKPVNLGAMSLYTYRQTADARIALDLEDKPGALAAVNAGEMTVLLAADMGQVTILVLTRTGKAD